MSEVGRSELAAEVQRRALASVSEKIEGIALSDDQILETTDYTEWKAVVDRLSELIDSQLDRLGLDADPTWKAQTIDSLDINSIITSNLEGISHSDDRTDDWGATQRSGMGIDEQIHDLFERDHGE